MIESSQSVNTEVTEPNLQKSVDKALLKLLLKLGLIMFAILAAGALFVGSMIMLGVWKAWSSGTFVD